MEKTSNKRISIVFSLTFVFYAITAVSYSLLISNIGSIRHLLSLSLYAACLTCIILPFALIILTNEQREKRIQFFDLNTIIQLVLYLVLLISTFLVPIYTNFENLKGHLLFFPIIFVYSLFLLAIFNFVVIKQLNNEEKTYAKFTRKQIILIAFVMIFSFIEPCILSLLDYMTDIYIVSTYYIFTPSFVLVYLIIKLIKYFKSNKKFETYKIEPKKNKLNIIFQYSLILLSYSYGFISSLIFAEVGHILTQIGLYQVYNSPISIIFLILFFIFCITLYIKFIYLRKKKCLPKENNI